MTKPTLRAIAVLDDALIENVDYKVCHRKGSPLLLHDELEGSCLACGHAVIFRRNWAHVERKLCVECSTAMAAPQ